MRDQTLIPSFQRPPSKVVIRRAANYEQDLSLLIQEGLSVFNPPVKDKTVLLKPNMVGLDPSAGSTPIRRWSPLRVSAFCVWGLAGGGRGRSRHDRDTEASWRPSACAITLGPLAGSSSI